MNHMKLRALCEGAVLVAVAEILSFIKLWEMPWAAASCCPWFRWCCMPCAGALGLAC